MQDHVIEFGDSHRRMEERRGQGRLVFQPGVFGHLNTYVDLGTPFLEITADLITKLAHQRQLDLLSIAGAYTHSIDEGTSL